MMEPTRMLPWLQISYIFSVCLQQIQCSDDLVLKKFDLVTLTYQVKHNCFALASFLSVSKTVKSVECGQVKQRDQDMLISHPLSPDLAYGVYLHSKSKLFYGTNKYNETKCSGKFVYLTMKYLPSQIWALPIGLLSSKCSFPTIYFPKSTNSTYVAKISQSITNCTNHCNHSIHGPCFIWSVSCVSSFILFFFF